MDRILGIVNLHNNVDLGELTKSKNIETVSFLGRYYFIDFVLSRFTNCKINSIEILIKNKPVSLFKHLSLGAKEWSVNTQMGGINLMYNELESKKSYLNTDFNTLLTNKKYLYHYDHAFVLVAPVNIISDIDYQKMMEEHIMSGKLITVAYAKCDKEKELFKGVDKMVLSEDQEKLKYFVKDDDNENVYMETFIIHRSKLIELLENFDPDDEVPTFKDIISYWARLGDVNVYEHKGFVRYFRNLENYVDYSMEMVQSGKFNTIFDSNNPVYTKEYNTTPTLYKKNSKIKRCYITNGCQIDGSVSNSILGRNVIVGKGAAINNSIIFSNAVIGENSVIEDAIIANGSVIAKNTKIKGNIKKPAYIQS